MICCGLKVIFSTFVNLSFLKSKMKRIIIICWVLLGIVSLLQAQPRITFDKSECELGEIMWKKPVTVTYTVINKGNKPLLIDSVEVSCDCMDPVWTRKPIQPKGFGTVSATFNANMLGHFQKSVAVYSNASDGPIYLSMNGVVHSEITDYSKEYPVQIGSFYLDKNSVEFPDVNRGDEPVAEINIVNASDKEYTPVLMHLPSYLEAESVPGVLAPRQAGKIKLTLHSSGLSDLGLTHTSVYLSRFPGDKVGEENEITIMAVLLPDFSKLTAAQRALAPKVKLSASELDLNLGTKKKVSGVITLTNYGRSKLEIQAIQVTASTINVSMSKHTLAPGESMKVKVTAVAEFAKKRRQTPRVMIITNDPNQPKTEIKVRVRK